MSNKRINSKVVIAILIVLVVLLAGYVVMDRISQAREKEKLGIFQQGIAYGYEQAVVQLMQQAATCQQVPVSFENQTLNLVAVECLEQN